MALEIDEWSQSEFLEQIRPVEQYMRAFPVEYRGPTGGFVLIATAKDRNGEAYILGNPTWRPTKGQTQADELAWIPREAAQNLIDTLWISGLRPSNGIASAGQLEAIQEHLGDLRKLVSKSHGVKLG
jgi:hypothetical protein